MTMNQQIKSNRPITGSGALNHYAELIDDLARFEPEIEAALSYAEGTHTYDDIVQMVLQGRLFFKALDKSYLLIEIINYPRSNHLNVFLAGGDLEEILNTQKDLEDMARSHECSHITLSGRKGWLKPLSKQGWRYSHATIVCEVSKDG